MFPRTNWYYCLIHVIPGSIYSRGLCWWRHPSFRGLVFRDFPWQVSGKIRKMILQTCVNHEGQPEWLTIMAGPPPPQPRISPWDSRVGTPQVNWAKTLASPTRKLCCHARCKNLKSRFGTDVLLILIHYESSFSKKMQAHFFWLQVYLSVIFLVQVLFDKYFKCHSSILINLTARRCNHLPLTAWGTPTTS